MSKVETYSTKDIILPHIDLGKSCKIEIQIEKDNVTLQIGPRDFEWARGKEELIGCGTILGMGKSQAYVSNLTKIFPEKKIKTIKSKKKVKNVR